MKKLKQVFSRVLIMACFLMVFAVNTETVSAAETVTVGDWTLSISNNVASIKSYNGTDTSVTIPTSLGGYKISKVGAKAFDGNTTLQQVYIPKEITTLENAAFRSCTSLSYVEIQGDLTDCNPNSTSWDKYTDVNRSYTISVFGNAGTNAESFVVKFTDSVTKIPAYLFASAKGHENEWGAHVTNVIISDSVKEIGDCAFYNCVDMKSVQMGAGVTKIGSSAFGRNLDMTNITLSPNLGEIGNSAFVECSSLESVALPSKVSKIGANCFKDCYALERLELPKNECTIGTTAFKNTTSLNTVVIKGDYADCNASSVKWDKTSASYNSNDFSVFCNSGTNAESFVVIVEDGVTKIPAYLFASAAEHENEYGAHVTNLILADSVKEIRTHAFYNCADLIEVQMGAEVTTIESYAFGRNYDLTNITWSKNLVTMGQGAFSNCTSLKTAVLPLNVSSIGASCFENCSALERLELPASDCKIGTIAFANTTSLNTVVIKGNYSDCSKYSATWDKYYQSSKYSVFSNAGTNADLFVVTVADGVKRIPAYLFASAAEHAADAGAHITKVVLPDTVEEIGKCAFYNCVDLEEINYSSALATIGEAAFRYDSKVGEIVLLDTVVNIGKNVFADCSNLTIKGIAESKAEEYAATNGIPFTRAEGWLKIFGKSYWHEGGYRQGTYDDPQGVLGDGTVRGREIYDPVSDGWYWLDAVYDGAKAINKEVWMPYIYQNEATWPEEEIRFNAEASGDMAEQVIREINNRTGKWVRYDENGKMYKGWYTVEGAQADIYPDQVGNTYFYDHRTGLMAKGEVEIDGVVHYFDPITGVLQW